MSLLRDGLNRLTDSFSAKDKQRKSSFRSYVDWPKPGKGASGSGASGDDALSGQSTPKTRSKEDPDEMWDSFGEDEDCFEMNKRSASYEALDYVDASNSTSFVALPSALTPNKRSSYQVTLEDRSPRGPSTASSFTCYRNNELILVKPMDGIIRYCLHKRRSKGTIGQLILTNVRLKFVNYHEAKKEATASSPSSNDAQPLPPFDVHSFLESEFTSTEFDDDLDLINVSNYKVEQCQPATGPNSYLLLTVYCHDLRCVEFQMRNNDLAKSLLDLLEKLIVDPFVASSSNLLTLTSAPSISAQRVYELPLLWYQLSREYSFFLPKDWDQLEGHWLQENQLLRITQCNENLQLCQSLPPSFVALKYYLSDVTLSRSISTQMKGQRVPVITFSTRASVQTSPEEPRFNLLMRSAILTEDVTNLMNEAVRPLRIIDLTISLPTLPTIIGAYSKLRELCLLNSDTTHFILNLGKWMKIVLRVLQLATELVKIVQEEASVLIMEDSDKHLNPVLSALVQVLADPKRRTIEGFESLLSKEFMSLCGFSNRLEAIKSPDHVLFTLFLDCVWQLMSQNRTHFEFTSIYLIRLFDFQYVPSSIASNCKLHGNFGEATYLFSDEREARNSSISPFLAQLSVTQLMFAYNPFYKRGGRAAATCFPLKVPSKIVHLVFFEPLYLRWYRLPHKIHYYDSFPLHEVYYFNQLLMAAPPSPAANLIETTLPVLADYSF